MKATEKTYKQKITGTGVFYNIGGIKIEIVDIEPCLRLSQYGKGEKITCKCSMCKEKNQTPEEAKKILDRIYKNL